MSDTGFDDWRDIPANMNHEDWGIFYFIEPSDSMPNRFNPVDWANWSDMELSHYGYWASAGMLHEHTTTLAYIEY